MDTGSDYLRFRLPLLWYRTARLLKHTARNGSTGFEIQREGNGYLRLQLVRTLRPTITIDVMFLAEFDAATTVLLVDMTRTLRFNRQEHQQANELMKQFQSDTEFFATRMFSTEDEAMRMRKDDPALR